MNKKINRVFFIAAIVIVGMFLFPPFSFYSRDGMEINMGYSFLLNPPEFRGLSSTVNTAMLMVQWICVLLVTAIIYFIKRD